MFGHCFFEPLPFGRLETTYDVHLGLTGKRVTNNEKVQSALIGSPLRAFQ